MRILSKVFDTTVLIYFFEILSEKFRKMSNQTWKERSRQLDFLKDFPAGPLDEYRKQASFDWKVMTLVMEPEEVLRFKVNLNFILSSQQLVPVCQKCCYV